MMNKNFDIRLPTFEPGWVWLAGAGPGDPTLLTIGTYHGLKNADVVVYDALVGDEIVKLARPEATLEYAGKRGGRPSTQQQDISNKLIQHAKAGKRVLRLKGGDPFVFGRGGDECLALVEANVPFRVIPGITAGVGGPAYAGIPVTHRDHNTAVTFITGHTASNDIPGDINWPALSQGSPVLIFYMAARNLKMIADQLMAAGRDATEPVVVISRATLPDQVVLETCLATCAEDLAKAKLKTPTLIVVGPVAGLRNHLNWFNPK
ncbi:MAG: uroporphyrinogen-III C-methyltransferase [Rhodospirillales bacterium]|jgi:uroporphyrin-III C-methyltransferase